MSAQDGSHRRVTPLTHDDGSAHILHVDMDAFFASVELLDRPELRHRPVIVGRREPRAVVTTANYAARQYGVHSAMPVATALRLCPTAVVIPPRHHLYRQYSQRVMDLLRSYTPRIEPVSVDEAWMDVSGSHRLFGGTGRIAAEIRRRMRDDVALTCSIGAAPTKFVAKLASGMAKPDGLLIVNADEVAGFLTPLPVGALAGVGEHTRAALHRLGIETVGQLREISPARLQRSLGAAQAAVLVERASGRQQAEVAAARVERSIGKETTFPVDETDPERLRAVLVGLADRSAAALRAADLLTRTVVLKLRDGAFRTITRSVTLPAPTATTQELIDAAQDLLTRSGWDRPTRLIGVRFASLVPTASGLARDPIWGDASQWRAVDAVADRIAARFGTGTVAPASTLRAQGGTADPDPRIDPDPSRGH